MVHSLSFRVDEPSLVSVERKISKVLSSYHDNIVITCDVTRSANHGFDVTCSSGGNIKNSFYLAVKDKFRILEKY